MMRIGIRNRASGKTYCDGLLTEVFLIDSDGTERLLHGVRRVQIDIDAEHPIEATLQVYPALLDLGPVCGRIDGPGGKYLAQQLHNRAEMERIGVSRIH